MNVSNIISQARDITGVGDRYIYDARAAAYLDNQYKILREEVIRIDSSIGFTNEKINTVDGTNKYTLTQADAGTTTFGIRYPEQINIKYGSSDNYVNCSFKKFDELLPGKITRYEANQGQNNPFCVISYDDIYIYPTPTANVTDGLKVYGYKMPYDIDENSTESDILLPTTYHNVLVYGLAVWLYASRGSSFEQDRISMIRTYDIEKKKAKRLLANNVSRPVYGENKDLSYLE